MTLLKEIHPKEGCEVETEPDLVMSDNHMPNLDGIELRAELRTHHS